MSVKDEAHIDWEQGMKYKDIAAKHNVSEGTVKSWASRYWKADKKVATKRQKRLQPQPSAELVVKAMADSVEENKELTVKQKEFCIRFMQNRNATQAYLRVYGCSYESALANGSRSLGNAKIQSELKRLREIKNAALGGLCGDDIVEFHMRIAFSDITDFVEFKNRRVPDTDRSGELIYMTHPDTGEKILKTHIETNLLIKDSKTIDGTLLAEVSQSKGNMTVKLADRMKSLQFLENYFELNPNLKLKKQEFEIKKKTLESQESNSSDLLSGFLQAFGGTGDDNKL